jgi:hypothetical protein
VSPAKLGRCSRSAFAVVGAGDNAEAREPICPTAGAIAVGLTEMIAGAAIGAELNRIMTSRA